jgi:hypothetical protein
MLGARHANLKFDRSGAPADIVVELEGIRGQNDVARARRGKLTRRAILTTVYLVIGAPIAFVCLMLGFATLGTLIGDGDDTVFALISLFGIGLGALQALIAFILVVMFWVQRSRVSLLDIDEAKLGAATALLRTLALDVRPGVPVRVYVDFTSTVNHPGYNSPSGQLHQQRWFHCSMPLADKSMLRIDALVRLKRRSVRKRRYTKHKDKYQDVIDVRVGVRGGTLPPDAAARIQTRFAYAFPRLMKCRIAPKSAAMRFATAPAVLISGRGDITQGAEQRLDGRKLLNLVLRTYRSVSSARVPDARR